MQENLNERSALGGNRNADTQNTNENNFKQNKRKIKPGYFSELQFYPNADPIFVALDWASLNFIRNHHGVCLLCDKNSELYDFSFLKGKYVWVLYSEINKASIAIKLANTVLRSSMKEVQVIPVSEEHLEGDAL